MDYTPKKLMTDDYFKLLKFICSDIFQYKAVRGLLWETFIVHFVVNIVTIYYFMYKLNTEEIILYTPTILCELYPMFGILVLLLNDNLMDYIRKDLPLWSLENSNRIICEKIKKQVKLFTTYAIINFLISSIGGIAFIENLSLDETFFFAIRFFREFTPLYSNFFCFLYKLHIPLLGYIMIVHAYQVIYYTQHQNFQIYMFQPYIQNISNWDNYGKEPRLYYNLNYQKEVRKRLIVCIRRSSEFVNYKKLSDKRNISLIVGFSILGCLLGLGVAMYFFSGSVTSEYYFRMGLTAIGAVFVFSGLIWSGQSLENNFQEMEELIKNVAWYNFNGENKIIYLIFLINVRRDRRVTFSENNAINYKLGLSVLRGIYSILSVFLRMNYAK